MVVLRRSSYFGTCLTLALLVAMLLSVPFTAAGMARRDVGAMAAAPCHPAARVTGNAHGHSHAATAAEHGVHEPASTNDERDGSSPIHLACCPALCLALAPAASVPIESNGRDSYFQLTDLKESGLTPPPLDRPPI